MATWTSLIAYVAGMFKSLAKRGYIEHRKVENRNVAFITDAGRDYVLKNEAALMEQYAKAHGGT